MMVFGRGWLNGATLFTIVQHPLATSPPWLEKQGAGCYPFSRFLASFGDFEAFGLQTTFQQFPHGGSAARHARVEPPIIQSRQFFASEHYLQALGAGQIGHGTTTRSLYPSHSCDAGGSGSKSPLTTAAALVQASMPLQEGALQREQLPRLQVPVLCWPYSAHQHRRYCYGGYPCRPYYYGGFAPGFTSASARAVGTGTGGEGEGASPALLLRHVRCPARDGLRLSWESGPKSIRTWSSNRRISRKLPPPSSRCAGPASSCTIAIGTCMARRPFPDCASHRSQRTASCSPFAIT
jgi:hypothetical protein